MYPKDDFNCIAFRMINLRMECTPVLQTPSTFEHHVRIVKPYLHTVQSSVCYTCHNIIIIVHALGNISYDKNVQRISITIIQRILHRYPIHPTKTMIASNMVTSSICMI